MELETERRLKVAALADLHYTKDAGGTAADLFREIAARADVCVLCGDLTDYGLPEEAEALLVDLEPVLAKPCLAVLGNHDFESDAADKLAGLLTGAGIKLLNGESLEIAGVGFAGTAGFGGGFGKTMLNAWGEKAIKEFVREAVDQSLRLERALARLNTPFKVAILHYSPIRDTVVGESPEIFPFLGTSRLEEAIDRYEVRIALHGHAHNGQLHGRTAKGADVYNVAIPVLRRDNAHVKPYRLLEIPVNPAAAP
ncbi:MAG: metallophosphoesterase [Verrucomicrobia bacterium]|nr:metallophosphoesterase [Verrucomicrobiota bacterium]